MENPITLTIAAGHAKITLNRPERLNALTRDLLIAAKNSILTAIEDKNVRAILVTGSGRGFCAGQDLSERDPRKLQAPLDLESIQKELFHPVVTALQDTSKPVVSAVNGVAAGGGLGIALAADIVIAAENAKFAFSFAKVGLSVDAGLGRALALRIGMARASALLMLGEDISAMEAEKIGLIWRAVPAASLEDETMALVEKLSRTPPASIAGIKASLAASNLPLQDYLKIEAKQQGIAGVHPDYAEGVLAFLERRAPTFS